MKVATFNLRDTGALRRIFYRAGHLLVPLFINACLIVPGYVGAQSSPSAGVLQGSVFIVDSDGTSYVPGVKVSLRGPKILQTETDEKGQYNFHDLVPGTYTINVSFSGLQATEDITVAEGNALKLDLELKPVAVETSVTVSETYNDTNVPVPPETITEKTIDDAPNANERIESLLPFVPGVVRGPDGRINMKGTRNTQSGALVNSANVTDPATGGSAINLPIDVVSSVQVISDPYDPQ